MDTFPLIPVDLIEELRRRYPDRSPNPSDSEREIWMKAGEQRFRRMLDAKYNDQIITAQQNATPKNNVVVQTT
jgi:hypothetical protein